MIKKSLSALTFVALLSSCGAKDVDKIGDAQQCLDSSTKATASTCIDIVAGIESAGAYNVRCAGKFISEGYGTTELLATLEALSGSGGSLTSFLDYIAFSSKQDITQDDTSASDAFTYCYKSAGKGATLLAAFSNISTSMYKMLNSCSAASCPTVPNGTSGRYAVQTCISNSLVPCLATIAAIADPNTADASVASFQSSIGSIVISTSLLSCSGNGANKTLCENFSTAITAAGGTSDRRKVAASFLSAILQ